MKAFVLALATLWAGAIFAQPPAAGAQPGVGRMDDLAVLLDLTDTQKAQVQTVLQEEHAQMRQAFQDAKASGTKPDGEQMHTLHEQLRQDAITKLTPILSAAQLKKFQIVTQHWMHGRPGHHLPNGNAAAPATTN
jgi:hypothetical protein